MSGHLTAGQNSSITRNLNDAQRSLLATIFCLDHYLRRSPNADTPQLVQIKLACLAALSDLGAAAKLEERRCCARAGFGND